METVGLKNGSVEAVPLVVVTLASLRSLFEERPIHAFELVQICRNPGHVLFEKTGEDLVALSLVTANFPETGHSVHDSVRNIVLSAVLGEGFDLTLGDPVVRPDVIDQ